MITCKDAHVRATGRGNELLEDFGAIAAALVENGHIGWRLWAAAAAGVETALDHMHEKEEK